MDGQRLVSCKPGYPSQQRKQMLIRAYVEEQKRQTFQKQLQQKRLKEMYDFDVHASLQNCWRFLQQQDFVAEVAIADKASSKHTCEMKEEISHVEQEIQAFEKKGYELGAEINDDTAEKLKMKEKTNETGKEKRKDIISSKKDLKGPRKQLKPDDYSDSAEEGKTYLEDVKERITKAEKEKYDLQQKKKKEMLEKGQRERELEELQRKTQEENFQKEKSEEVLHLREKHQIEEDEQQDLITRRLHLEHKIAEQRNREWEAVLAHDHEMLLMLQQDRDIEVSHQLQLWQEAKAKKIEKKKIKHVELCGNIFLQEAMMMEYLHEEGEWKWKQSVGGNEELGKILVEIFKFEVSLSKSTPPEILSDMTLKLAVLGPPYSGKTTLAKMLETQFGIVRIEIEKVIASAVAGI